MVQRFSFLVLPSSRQAKYRCCTLKLTNTPLATLLPPGQGLLLGAAPPKHRSPLNVQRAICWPHVADSDQQDIDQRPYPQAAEAEELAEAFSPLAQVEPVCAEATEGDAGTPNKTGSTRRLPSAHDSARSHLGRDLTTPTRCGITRTSTHFATPNILDL